MTKKSLKGVISEYKRELKVKKRVEERNNKEKNNENNGSYVQTLLNSAACAVNVSVSPKSESGSGSAGLKKNGARKKNCDDCLEDVQNHITGMVAGWGLFVKMGEEKWYPIGKRMDNDSHKVRRVLLSIGGVIILVLVLAFFWRVFTFYRQIQSGDTDYSALHFNATKSDTSALLALAASAPGSGELATKDDPSLGNASAPLTIVEFADFGCPFSAEESYVVRALAKQYPDDIRFIYRDFPIPELHEGADLAAAGGECAREQGKFWEYHDFVFGHQAAFTSDLLVSYADEIGLDTKKFSSCLNSAKYEAEVQTDLADGVKAGARGTPTFFVNGVKIEGDVPFSVFTEIIHAFLKK
jgi:protein-disulfide isomerase